LLLISCGQDRKTGDARREFRRSCAIAAMRESVGVPRFADTLPGRCCLLLSTL
jgi:hypothetical protein